MSYLNRYEAGEHEQVWREISPCYWKDAQTEPFRSEVLAVARATMTRVKHNIALLVPRLEALGYAFGYEWMDDDERREWAGDEPPVVSSPLPDIQERFSRLEEAGIRLPISLQAWYEIVGAVNFVGTPPSNWSRGGYDLDPLRVDPLDDNVIAECMRDKQLCLSPDEYFKYYTSGGGPYYVDIDRPSTDALIRGGWLVTDFVEYLRIALSWGGFPGIGRWAKRPTHDIALLTDGLLPF